MTIPGATAWFLSVVLALAGSTPLTGASENAAPAPFVIRVVDASSGRGVPLIELRTVHQARFVTDNAGIVAISDPELLGEEVFFHVRGHGYQKATDHFGYRGARLKVVAGGNAEIEIDRLNIAERLYRVTGAGLYDHSIRAGRETPLAQPLLNARVFGSDSVLNAIWKGRLFWIWGDTNRPAYPLGNFQATAALSDLPGKGGLDPDVGVDLRYFTRADGFVKGIAPLPGDGPTWLSGLVVLPDQDGREHLGAHFVKVKPPMKIYRRGLCEWDEDAGEFVEIKVFDDSQKATPSGHPFRQEIDGKTWVTFADPLPTLRIPATWEAWQNPAQYEALDTGEEFHDAVGGERVKPHRGSLTWNEHRQRWVMIFTETAGKPSFLGEVWYAEAKSPDGPWKRCVRIVTHDRYSFYNPRQHPCFAKDGGRVIYFEGTYTASFSGNADKTPKYDYNQCMYRLDLDDERLAPARTD